MGLQLSAETSDVFFDKTDQFLLVEGDSPVRLDIVTTLRKRFPQARLEHIALEKGQKPKYSAWHQYDLVVINFPCAIYQEISWLEEIKQRGRHGEGPILIVLTDSPERGRSAIWAGADLYMAFDVSSSEFSARLDSALEVERLFRQHPVSLPAWHLLEVLHNSENAVIFLAEDRDGQKGVIKRFKFDMTFVPVEAIESFAEGMQLLINHKDNHLVKFIDAGIADDAAYLVMEYVPGETLKFKLDDYSQFDLAQRLLWFSQVVEGLASIHQLGLLHRDLKSSNILIREDESVVLLDFGMENRLLLEAGFIRENEIYCTPFYVSPERIVGESASEQSDLYALGVLLYEILVGDKPFFGENLAEVLQKHMFDSVPELPDDLSCYQPLLRRLLAKSSEGRLGSAREVLSQLSNL